MSANNKFYFKLYDWEEKFKDKPLSVVSNKDTRILWNGPRNWLVVSTKKDLLKNILQNSNDN